MGQQRRPGCRLVQEGVDVVAAHQAVSVVGIERELAIVGPVQIVVVVLGRLDLVEEAVVVQQPGRGLGRRGVGGVLRPPQVAPRQQPVGCVRVAARLDHGEVVPDALQRGEALVHLRPAGQHDAGPFLQVQGAGSQLAGHPADPGRYVRQRAAQQ